MADSFSMHTNAPATDAQTRQNSGFFAWWGRELRGIFAPAAPLNFKHPRRRLVVAASKSGARWLDETDQSLKQIGPETDSAGAPPEALAIFKRLSARRRAVPVGVRLEKASCFERRIELPESARGDFARILDLDLERATPFKRSDVYTAVCEDRALPAARGKVALRQFVAKRDLIDEQVRLLNSQGLDVSFADCWDQDGSKPLAIDFLANPAAKIPAETPGQTLPKILGLAALFLAGTAAWLTFDRGTTALAALETKIATAKSRAQAARTSVDTAELAYKGAAAILDLRSNRIPAAAIVDEVSRLLPDTAFVADLRIEKGKLSLTGLAASAAELVPIIERSELLDAAALTAPVLLDSATNKEQFKIEASVSTKPQTQGGEKGP